MLTPNYSFNNEFIQILIFEIFKYRCQSHYIFTFLGFFELHKKCHAVVQTFVFSNDIVPF